MKKGIYAVALFNLLVFFGCTTSKKTTIPLSQTLEMDDTYTIIWNGISKAFRYENGQWVRTDQYDYIFDVVQKRYENHWKSVKSLHRIHPDYDGKAGERDQTMFFEVIYKDLVNEKVQAKIQSSLGPGTGTTDTEFRRSELTMHVPNASKFMPYNMYRIKQNYDYEQGLLTETVELIKAKDGKETPFMKNEETAMIFLKGKLNTAPTAFVR